MNETNRYADLSDEQLQGIHAACEKFEQALRNGEPIRIEDCLAAAAEETRSPLLRELLAIEIERQWPSDRKGLAIASGWCDLPARLAEFRARFPDRLSDIEGVFRDISEAWSPDDTPELGRTEPERLPISISVPGYEIEGMLGRGGMGVVYKARHLKLKRTVALKVVLAGGYAGPRELARFRIEAEAVARLSHPNIVQIHEVGEANGLPYCALEFVEGGNLASKLDGKPMPARDAGPPCE